MFVLPLTASILPVESRNTVPVYMESTLDEAAQDADIITRKYLSPLHEQPPGITITGSLLNLLLHFTCTVVCHEEDVMADNMSIATDSYLRRHRLLPEQHNPQVLDVGRLRALPKLI